MYGPTYHDEISGAASGSLGINQLDDAFVAFQAFEQLHLVNVSAQRLFVDLGIESNALHGQNLVIWGNDLVDLGGAASANKIHDRILLFVALAQVRE